MSDSTPTAPAAVVDPPAGTQAAPAPWPTPPEPARPAGFRGGAVSGTLEQVLAQARGGDSAALARYLVLRRGVAPAGR